MIVSELAEEKLELSGQFDHPPASLIHGEDGPAIIVPVNDDLCPLLLSAAARLRPSEESDQRSDHQERDARWVLNEYEVELSCLAS